MKQVNSEIVKGQDREMNRESTVRDAQLKVRQIEMEAQGAEVDARALELELMNAQAAHERREEAEKSGRETNEKIGELTG